MQRPDDLRQSTALGTGWWGLIDSSWATSFLSWLPLPGKCYFPQTDLTNCKPLRMALPKKRGLLSELLVILIWEESDGCSNSFFISAVPCSPERERGGCGEAALCGRELPSTFLQGEQRTEQFAFKVLALRSPNHGFVFKSYLFLTSCD